ncbi:MAG: TlyA family RNA methyltransferase [Elusimicrobiota bacterium]
MLAKKIRLDDLIFQKGLVSSCNKSTALVMEGKVTVDGKIITKPGFAVSETSEISVKESAEFVSRGGIKLKKALEEFSICVKDKICLDVGASTGGFTDCLLKNGAKKVYCVDVGYGILDSKLRNDPRVVVIEKTNIRYFGRRELTRIVERELARIERRELSRIKERVMPKADPPSAEITRISHTLHITHYTLHDFLPDLAVIDVSFISLEKVLPKVKELVKTGGEIIALLKPQFEAPKGSTKNGVVQDEKIRQQTIDKIKNFSKTLGLSFLGEAPSPIKGPKGNLEHFLYFRNSNEAQSE